jgi:hypothetical protein
MKTPLYQVHTKAFTPAIYAISRIEKCPLISIAVVALALITARVTKWVSKSEDRIKQIECTDPRLERELVEIFHCWQHKPLPNF